MGESGSVESESRRTADRFEADHGMRRRRIACPGTAGRERKDREASTGTARLRCTLPQPAEVMARPTAAEGTARWTTVAGTSATRTAAAALAAAGGAGRRRSGTCSGPVEMARILWGLAAHLRRLATRISDKSLPRSLSSLLSQKENTFLLESTSNYYRPARLSRGRVAPRRRRAERQGHQEHAPQPRHDTREFSKHTL